MNHATLIPEDPRFPQGNTNIAPLAAQDNGTSAAARTASLVGDGGSNVERRDPSATTVSSRKGVAKGTIKECAPLRLPGYPQSPSMPLSPHVNGIPTPPYSTQVPLPTIAPKPVYSHSPVDGMQPPSTTGPGNQHNFDLYGRSSHGPTYSPTNLHSQTDQYSRGQGADYSRDPRSAGDLQQNQLPSPSSGTSSKTDGGHYSHYPTPSDQLSFPEQYWPQSFSSTSSVYPSQRVTSGPMANYRDPAQSPTPTSRYESHYGSMSSPTYGHLSPHSDSDFHPRSSARSHQSAYINHSQTQHAHQIPAPGGRSGIPTTDVDSLSNDPNTPHDTKWKTHSSDSGQTKFEADYCDIDDPYDVDDDMELEVAPPQPKNWTEEEQREGVGLLVALQANRDDITLRSMRTFLNEPNILATYRPSASESPLMDPKTARIFCHFVSVTGPSLSIYERVACNPSVMFTGAVVPPSQRSLWSYTLPTLALGNQALLHAILALSSLQIAKLQGGSMAPSYRHYHMALRRVAKCVGLPTRRGELATLAATMLLGFYEVMSSEHTKWSSHLAGAKRLFLEIDFGGMTKQIKATRQRREANRRARICNEANYMSFGNPQLYANLVAEDTVNTGHVIDENFVAALTGLAAPSDDTPPRKTFTAKDLEIYETQCDLWWWFCKQDVYQSILSGNSPLVDYESWSRCPPRAPPGKLDAIFGTYDHLVLLLGRIATFCAKDLKRKLKSVKANGGVWQPPAVINLGPPPKMKSPFGAESPPQAGPQRPPDTPFPPPSSSASPSNSPAQAQASPTTPMYGMMPPKPKVRLPDGFDDYSFGHTSTPSPPNNASSNGLELDVETKLAEQEWESMKAATALLEASFGPDFQPLTAEYISPQPSPFGPALHYRTYSIACIWQLYHLMLIILERVHPSMPPAAQMAAGVAAAKTAKSANEIGRITAGLLPDTTNQGTSLNPLLAAALLDVSIGLFFSGVQFSNPEQRAWTVENLTWLTAATGWDVTSDIAAGCEVSWIKQAEAGRGPPYTRRIGVWAKDPRISGARRRNAQPGNVAQNGSANGASHARAGDAQQTPSAATSPNENATSTVGYDINQDPTDRRFIVSNPSTRVYWAIGLLGVEEDLQQLNV
ncbi:MAG: hypothetical protein M1829_006659 [Trizodia sp. TS-e1964]|nr:MAG: hypothetical protein M1829_006659 [Trizodia sp. TS-e1964]